MKLAIIINHINHKGGVNNLEIVSVMNGFLTLATFTGKTAKSKAKAYINKWNASRIEFTELLASKRIKNLAESHLEAWKDRYKEYKTKKELRFDLKMNRDSSLEIERAEEDLGRKLTDKEKEILIDRFNKEVVKQFKL